MKRVLKKLIVFVLAFALILPAFSVPESAAAASKITNKAGNELDSKIFVGRTYHLKVADTKVKFYSSNKKVATVGMTTGTLKAVGPGNVTITAKSIKTGKKVASHTFKVLKRATSVSGAKDTLYLYPGEAEILKAKLKPADSTDVVYFYSSDSSVARAGLTKGKITARKNGEATITLYAKATKETSKYSKNNRIATVQVFVGPYIEKAEQTELSELKLTFKRAVEASMLKPEAFDIINKETGETLEVKDISISLSGKEATLTLDRTISDGRKYTIYLWSSSAEFTATDMQVAGLRIEPAQAEVKKQTQIKLALLDKNGVVIKRCLTSDVPKNIDFKVTAQGGYVSYGGNLYLSSMNAKGIATATYHSGRFVNGEEVGNIETGEVIITPFENPEEEQEEKRISYGSSNPYSVQYTVGEEVAAQPMTDGDASSDAGAEASGAQAKADSDYADFENPIHSVHLDSTPGDKEPVRIYFTIKRNRSEIQNYSDYTVSSSKPYIAEVLNTEATDGGSSENIAKIDEKHSVLLQPKEDGEIYLLLRDADGRLIKSLTLKISSEDGKPYKFMLVDENTHEFINQMQIDYYPQYSYDEGGNIQESRENMSTSAFIKVKDQYGKFCETEFTEENLSLEEEFNRFDAKLEAASGRISVASTESSSSGTSSFDLFYNTGSVELTGNFDVIINRIKITLETNPNYWYNAKDYESEVSYAGFSSRESKIISEAYIIKCNGKIFSQSNNEDEAGSYVVTHFSMGYRGDYSPENNRIRFSTIRCKVRFGEGSKYETPVWAGSRVPVIQSIDDKPQQGEPAGEDAA